jgi:thiosulfate reductase / polysulfide reductase chain A
LALEVLKDESLIPFHACSDVVYSETAHYADMILPDASYMERWGFDTRNNMELRDYVTLRQPMVPPPAECKSFVDSLIEIGKRIGPDTAKSFAFKDHEEWMRQRCVGLTRYKGMARRGFITPSRKFSVYHPDIEAAARARGFNEDGGKGMPEYFPVPSVAKMKPEQLHLVTFKWNVHTQGRTQSQKYLTEIVHHNPMWINTDTALKLGIKTGDMVEITTYRTYGHAMRGSGEVVGKALVPAWVTEGIHPRVLAVSNTLGNSLHGRVATARNGKKQALAAYDKTVIDDDADLDDDIWWDPARGGTGAGYNINAILPIQPAPLVGMQGWYDTICTVRKVRVDKKRPEVR